MALGRGSGGGGRLWLPTGALCTNTQGGAGGMRHVTGRDAVLLLQRKYKGLCHMAGAQHKAGFAS